MVALFLAVVITNLVLFSTYGDNSDTVYNTAACVTNLVVRGEASILEETTCGRLRVKTYNTKLIQ